MTISKPDARTQKASTSSLYETADRLSVELNGISFRFIPWSRVLQSIKVSGIKGFCFNNGLFKRFYVNDWVTFTITLNEPS